MKFKIGDWVTVEDYTFVIVRIGDYAIPGTTYTEEDAYFDMWYQGFVSCHCVEAKQEDIEKACFEMYEP